ncbi:PTB domain-containing adapter protein ced-6 [Cylas formicarius]|uniref:PTB domain-containing adapter protein ced-6 n=1 Tax=Cylas formicarius TaxID=197179 RepID=UPI002958A76C|nr:PTB domain-containing adapter protein ced-6 [Cylas formicarius]
MSTLLKWAQNTQVKLNGNKSSSSGERKWIHPPEALQKGHIAYLVKFFGNSIVDQPKGIEVVKEAIRKLRFSQQIRKSETGEKTKKIELTISIDGVAIQEPKIHTILYQFPLHQISYCADDKGEKRFFSFIVKQPNQGSSEVEEKYECFVFISDKLAEEITLTIGQAFELAYKRFLDTSGKDLEAQRRAMITQQKMKEMENENNILKQRLLEISQFASIKYDLDQYLQKKCIRNILEIKSAPNSFKVDNKIESADNSKSSNGTVASPPILNFSEENNFLAPPVPPRSLQNIPAVGTKLEGLLLTELEHDDNFDPRSFEQSKNSQMSNSHPIAPPPKAARRSNVLLQAEPPKIDEHKLFGMDPFDGNGSTTNSSTKPKVLDPFEMGDFGSDNSTTSQDIENAIGLLDKRILEMKTGFSRGISFGNDDFSLDNLDPLKN